MNKKLIFFSMIVAIVAISIGAISTTQESQIEPQLVQRMSSAMVDATLEQIGNHADFAIVGTVLTTTPVIYVDPDRAADKTAVEKLQLIEGEIKPIVIEKEILTDVKIKVEEDLFGKYDEKIITVRVPGGEIPTQKTIHEQSPPFVKGERVIVFVGNGQSYDISEDNYTVLGLEQGTIKLGEKVKSKFANDNTTETEIKNQIKSLR